MIVLDVFGMYLKIYVHNERHTSSKYKILHRKYTNFHYYTAFCEKLFFDKHFFTVLICTFYTISAVHDFQKEDAVAGAVHLHPALRDGSGKRDI